MELTRSTCDCCEWFGHGQQPIGQIKLCKACNKWFCEGCWYSKKRVQFFLKYMAQKLVYGGNLPDHLEQHEVR
jgi:hypothetical protein